MTIRTFIDALAGSDSLNFALTNRIPRRALTRFMGWFSKVEQPLVRDLSIRAFQLFCAPDLSEAKKGSFRSLHDCFVRELKDGARPIDPDPGVLTSPCDGDVVAAGPIRGDTLLQVKGSSYSLNELLCDPALAERYRNGCYVTLRLTAGMYHRFHAPDDCRAERVTHIPGDVWNVNPPALKRIEKLYCRNERAVVTFRLARDGNPLALVAVAAVLVAGIRLRFLDVAFDRAGSGPATFPCAAAFARGEELGWFEHGSTIVVLAPAGVELCRGIGQGRNVRMGEPLLLHPPPPASEHAAAQSVESP